MKKTFCDFCWFTVDCEEADLDAIILTVLFVMYPDKKDICSSCFARFAKTLKKAQKFGTKALGG